MTLSPITEGMVREAISSFQDPETGRPAAKLGQIHRLTLADDRLEIALGLTTWARPLWEDACEELAALLRANFPQLTVSVLAAEHARKPEKIGEMGLMAKSVIAVGAGKGGVGKSSIAAYLACGLSRLGCKVGLMDADVYGPSVPHLLGIHARPTMVGSRIQPIIVDHLKVMSMGLLVPPREAVIWRGPMLHSALTQFLRDTDWGELDYLIIDMPPGTGDVAISLSHLLPITGAVVVSTPQDVALLDATKAIAMFGKVSIDVLGIVENMSFFLCPNCSARHDIFGSGGARRRAEELGVPFLGEVPIQLRLRELADAGRVGDSYLDAEAAPYLTAICRRLVQDLRERRRRSPLVPSLPILGQAPKN